MSESKLIIKFLESIPSRGCCDDCLARKSGIRPRQLVGRICRQLASEGTLIRKKGRCPLGNHTKLISTLASKGSRASRRSGARKPPQARTLAIEEAWRYIDRFCRALWARHMNGEPPASLAESITTLRDEELLPVHQANMMHTIRSLRNLVVHENLDFGDHERTIARAAWQIVRDWAEHREAEAWRLAATMCARHAA